MNNKDTTEVAENSHHLKIFLPKKLLECLPRCPLLPPERLRWNTNEEIASYLITFEKHDEWLSCSPKTRPQNGSIILYNRKKVKYRKDGYCWKKRKDGKTTREDHMKLKVQGMECLYGCYVHSSIVPTFHRRCYWLLQNPDIVLVHYLNVPALEDCGKGCGPILCSISSDRREWLKWSREELVGQLKPMFHGIKWSCGNGAGEFSVEQLVQQILDTHQAKPLPRTHACLCSGGLVPVQPDFVASLLPPMATVIIIHLSIMRCQSIENLHWREIGKFSYFSFSFFPTSFFTTGSTGSLPHKCSNTKHRIISPKIEPRTLAIPPAPPPRPPEPLPRVAPLRTEPPEPPKVDTSPSSSSSSSSGFAEPPEISSRHPVAPGGLPRAAPALLLLTGLEQLTGGLTPSRHLAPQPEFGPSLGLALVLGPQPPAPPCPPSPAFDPDRFFNNPSQGQTYGGGLGVSPNFPEAEAARTPCPALEPAAALEPVASDQGTTSKPGERREGNRFFIQDDASGEGTGPATVSSSPSMEPAARPGRGEGLFGAPGGTSELETFSLSSFPDLMGDLISEEAPGAPGPPALSVITDFSPEWSYPEGGVKVLITGPWTEVSERYSCVFDHILVPASLVQSGVLRCYCPAHEAGLVSLQVAGEEGPLSASVLFEYRARRFLALPSTQLDWLSLDDNQFRMSILERLEQMENRMAEIAAAGQVPPPGSDQSPVQGGVPGPGFEARVVVLVERMIPRYGWRGPDHLVHGGPFRGMSLLHLAAAQGYARLIETLSQWRTMEAESLDLEQEVDPLNVDHFSCTPLMWACALGHLEAAVLLFRWNHQALHIPDSLGRLPLTVAHSRGHVQLARCLEELQRQEASVKPLPTPSPSSASPDTGLSSVSSPSELSDGTFSVTSAYSNAPDSSPPSAPLPISEGAVEVTQSSQSSHGLPELPSVFMDYKDSSPKGLPLPPSPHSTVETPIQGYGASSKGIDCHQAVDVLQVDMISLAKQIVEATPERIKQEDFGSVPMAGGSLQEQVGAMGLNETMSWLASYLENVDHLPNLPQHSRKLPLEQGHLAVPPAPSWAEFLGASANGKMESDFALLTLSDHEQRELYEAGRVIQTPFRKYKFALYKKMTQAAILIQSKFRSYYEQKRFQQSRRAAVLIQQHYRSYRCRPGPCHRPSGPSGPLPPRSKGSFLTKKQDQAARKIMRFLRRCQHRMKELKQNQELESLPQPELAT
ncbi:calmodulin-binding transcription activator 2 isoform X5 [Monodelphis domestica]|uniref:calmodulin-binding transcription activator 2 isoform X5 n=1 Tax=Monodelphis domestica TaxID=13616 RepID=UPI0024E20181|nr:calmodulin-binding transcription activator 2 isoform X5 [Monodelphis domestica]